MMPIPVSSRIGATAAVVFLVVPLVALLMRVPWLRVPEILVDPAVSGALGLSLRTAVVSTMIAALLGVPCAWWLAARTGPLREAVRVVVSVPLVLPPVVAGVALLYALGRGSFLGDVLSHAGVSIAYTTSAVVLAQTFVALPFIITTVDAALTAHGHRGEEVAATLGFTPRRAFFLITLPTIRPALLTALALGFARALGEFGATLTVAGAIAGRTQTLPVAINALLGYDIDAALTAAALMLVIACLILGLLRTPALTGGVR